MSFSFPDTRILVFTKLPFPGKCKSRLIPVLGEEGAAQLQERLINKIIMDLLSFKLCPFEIWQSEKSDYFSKLFVSNSIHVPVSTQKGDDLGERMSNAMGKTLKEISNVIIIGSDCILYNEEYLKSAIVTLQSNSVILGPAEDGGYVLIGMNQRYPTLFEGINWGSDTVFAQTILRLQQGKITYKSIRTLWDIDTKEDLDKLSLADPDF